MMAVKSHAQNDPVIFTHHTRFFFFNDVNDDTTQQLPARRRRLQKKEEEEESRRTLLGPPIKWTLADDSGSGKGCSSSSSSSSSESRGRLGGRSTPPTVKMPFNYHTHSGSYCLHAKGTLEEVVKRAIDLGFTHLGLSEHAPRYKAKDLYDEEVEAKMMPDGLVQLFSNYVKEARRLQVKYADQIKIAVGAETELITPDYLPRMKALKKTYKLDYLIGSVHHVDAIPFDFSLSHFKRAERECGGTQALYCRYVCFPLALGAMHIYAHICCLFLLFFILPFDDPAHVCTCRACLC